MKSKQRMGGVDWVFIAWFIGSGLASAAVLGCGIWAVVKLINWLTSLPLGG